MRNLKKITALMLVSVLTLALLIPGAGAYVYPDQSQINAKYVPAVNMLYELAVMQGNNGEFRPTSNLTRAEFSKMVYVVANRGSTNANNYQNVSEVSFQDYVSTDWFAGYVNWAAVQGVVEGKSPTRFDPQGNVTGYEAAKMLLVILGYRSNIEGYTGAGWTLRVLSDAQGAGLLDDLEDITDLGAPLTREQAAQILNNAVFAGMVEYKEQPSGWVVTARYVAGTLETVIETPAHLFFSLETLTGTYTANEWVALASGTTDEGKIRLSGVEETDGDPFNNGNPIELETTLDVDLLGQKVTVYARLNSKGEVAKIYGAPVATNEETIFTVNYSDIKAVTGGYTYTTGGKTYETTATTALYEDFKPLTTGLPADVGNESPARIFVDKNNKITQIFVTDYKFAQLTVSSSQKVTVKPAFGGGTNFQTSKAKEDFVIGADLIENNAYVLYSTLGEKYRLTAIEEVTGTVSYIRNNQATIGGTAYSKGTMSGADTDFAYAELSVEKVYYIFRGALLGSKTAASSSSDKYAVVIRSTYNGAFTGDGAASVYLLTDENKKVAYTINTLYKLDGTKASLNAGTIGVWDNGYKDGYPTATSGTPAAPVYPNALLWTGVICKYTITGEGSSAKVNLWPQGVTSHNVVTTKGQSYVDIDGGIGRVSATAKSVIFVQYTGDDEWVAYKGNALPTLPVSTSTSTSFPFSYIQKTRTNADNDTITVGYIDAHTDANPGDQGDDIILRGILTSDAYLTKGEDGNSLIGFDLYVGGDDGYKTYYADGEDFDATDIEIYKTGKILTATVVNDTKLGDDSYKIGRYKIAETDANKNVQAYAGYVSSVDDSYLYVADAVNGTDGVELGKTPKWTLNDTGNLIGFKFTSSTKIYLRRDGTEGRDDDYEVADTGVLGELDDYTVNKAQVVVVVNGGTDKPLEIIAVYVNEDQWEL